MSHSIAVTLPFAKAILCTTHNFLLLQTKYITSKNAKTGQPQFVSIINKTFSAKKGLIIYGKP